MNSKPSLFKGEKAGQEELNKLKKLFDIAK